MVQQFSHQQPVRLVLDPLAPEPLRRDLLAETALPTTNTTALLRSLCLRTNSAEGYAFVPHQALLRSVWQVVEPPMPNLVHSTTSWDPAFSGESFCPRTLDNKSRLPPPQPEQSTYFGVTPPSRNPLSFLKNPSMPGCFGLDTSRIGRRKSWAR